MKAARAIYGEDNLPRGPKEPEDPEERMRRMESSKPNKRKVKARIGSIFKFFDVVRFTEL